MPPTQFGTNDPRTQRKWSRAMFDYGLQDFFFLNNEWLGTGPNSVIRLITDLEGVNKSGDAVTVEIDVPLSNEGQGDGGTLMGNEEALAVLNQTLKIHERGHSVVSDGPLSEKRTATNFRKKAKKQLGGWIVNVANEPDLWRAIFGLYNASGISTVNELYPSSNRIVYGGGKLDGTVNDDKASDALLSAETTTDYLCNLQFLSKIRRKAELSTPKIIPVKVKGSTKKVYVVILHPYQIKSIRQQTGEAGFNALMKDCTNRGKDNPIIAGGEFFYDGMVIYSYDRAPMRTGAGGTTPAEGFLLNEGRTVTTDAVAGGKSVARGVLLGASSAMITWGMRPRWLEDKTDGRKPWIGTDMLYATSKTRFNEYTQPSGPNTAKEDFGVITFDTMVQPD